MKLRELKPTEDSCKERNHVGCGVATSSSRTSGRGHRSQKARSDGGVRPGFEGGQLSLLRYLPKRGFTNTDRKGYAIISLGQLSKFEDDIGVTPALLVEPDVIKNEKFGTKILGNGSLDKKLAVKAHKFSASAVEAADAKGGAREVV